MRKRFVELFKYVKEPRRSAFLALTRHHYCSVFVRICPGISKQAAQALLSHSLDLENNPWEDPPVNVVDEGPGAVVRYHEAIQSSGSTRSWRLKVVLVGAVFAGKTSLVRGLLAGRPELVPDEDRTRGVDLHIEHPWKPNPAEQLELVFWDFAGHSDYYSTHQLFLTSGAIHLLVVDLNIFVEDAASRAGSVYKWLDALLCRVPGSTVLLVATHIDQIHVGHEHALQVLHSEVQTHLAAKRKEGDRARKKGGSTPLQSASLNVMSTVVALSCLDAEGLLQLGRMLAKLATGREEASQNRLFPAVGKVIPVSWARASAAMRGLLVGTDPVNAAANVGDPPLISAGEAPPRKFLSWEDAVLIWQRVVMTLDLGQEMGNADASVVLEVRLNFNVCLWKDGLQCIKWKCLPI